METLNMNETFIHILKGNKISNGDERDIQNVCSLSFFKIDNPTDTHPNQWEIHPDGDELLLVTNGKLEVEIVTGTNYLKVVPHNPEIKKVIVNSGESIIVKKGHWHRLLLQKPTSLIVAGFRENSKLSPVI
ncbi:hypothetical protein KZP23_11260 [Echinicola marina]|uniref:cupin domain-containing protein n=1 Tax=Echinicola marina TaxID=2859768 RepID=UPI001CF71BAA|nr:cupin domain-containing protein [Echinicola marina]UCS95541.1 hypothetical protein KZP23_11260 [Echinicola marina]